MQRLSRLLLHQTRDKGGNAHNFPFDTLTKVYRDTVYATQEQYRGNPMYPERGAAAAAAAPSSSSSSFPPSSFPPSSSSSAPSVAGTRGAFPLAADATDVTNHVGGLGVMSAAGRAISRELLEEEEQRAKQQQQQQQQQQPRTLLKRRKGNTNSPFGAAQPPAPEFAAAAATAVGDAKLREARARRLTRNRRSSTASKPSGVIPVAGHDGRQADGAPLSQQQQQQEGRRHSGVQREVLLLFRQLLRETRKMHDGATRESLRRHIRAEFDRQADVPRRDVLKIEWSINYARRKREDLQQMRPDTKFHIR